MSNTNQMPDLDFDSLADLPQFTTPPAGVYELVLKEITAKTVASKPAVEFSFSVVSCEEQADPAATPAKANDTFTTLYFTDNEVGQGKLKEAIRPLVEFFGTRKLQEVAEQAKNLAVSAVVKVRKVGDKEYVSVEGITVL